MLTRDGPVDHAHPQPAASVRNALDPALIAQLDADVPDAGAATTSRVIVLTGAGTAFCAGADIDWMRAQPRPRARRERRATRPPPRTMFETIDACPQPVIARVQRRRAGRRRRARCLCRRRRRRARRDVRVHRGAAGPDPGDDLPLRAARDRPRPRPRAVHHRPRASTPSEALAIGLVHARGRADDLDAAVADAAADVLARRPGRDRRRPSADPRRHRAAGAARPRRAARRRARPATRARRAWPRSSRSGRPGWIADRPTPDRQPRRDRGARDPRLPRARASSRRRLRAGRPRRAARRAGRRGARGGHRATWTPPRSWRPRPPPAPTPSIPATASCPRTPTSPRRSQRAGLRWVGPPPAAMRALGDKIDARRLAEAAGVPVVPGYAGDDLADAALAREAVRLGAPLLVKAAAGGGGRGMRAVDDLGRAAGRARGGPARGGGRVRRRPRVPRAAADRRPPRRGADAAPTRHGAVHPPGRARLLAAAPPPEDHRGVAVPGRRRRPARRARRGRASRSAAAAGYARRRHRRVPARRATAAGASSS